MLKYIYICLLIILIPLLYIAYNLFNAHRCKNIIGNTNLKGEVWDYDNNYTKFNNYIKNPPSGKIYPKWQIGTKLPLSIDNALVVASNELNKSTNSLKDWTLVSFYLINKGEDNWVYGFNYAAYGFSHNSLLSDNAYGIAIQIPIYFNGYIPPKIKSEIAKVPFYYFVGKNDWLVNTPFFIIRKQLNISNGFSESPYFYEIWEEDFNDKLKWNGSPPFPTKSRFFERKNDLFNSEKKATLIHIKRYKNTDNWYIEIVFSDGKSDYRYPFFLDATQPLIYSETKPRMP